MQLKINDMCRVSWVNSNSHPDLLSGKGLQDWAGAPLSIIEVVGTLIFANDFQLVVAQVRTPAGYANIHKIWRNSIVKAEALAVVPEPADGPAPEGEPGKTKKSKDSKHASKNGAPAAKP